MMRSVKAPDAQILALWMEDIARHVDVVMVCCAVCLYICLAYGVCVCVVFCMFCDICGCGELAERSVTPKTKQNNREAVERKTVVCE